MQAFAQGGAFPFAMAFSRDSGAGAARSPEAGLSSGRGRMAFFSRGTVSGESCPVRMLCGNVREDTGSRVRKEKKKDSQAFLTSP